MKRIYNKPELRTVKLMAAESLLSASGSESITFTDSDETAISGGAGGGILSNKESEHDIWGNDGSSMWK